MTIQQVLNQLIQQAPPSSIWLERPAPHVLSLRLNQAIITRKGIPIEIGALGLGMLGLAHSLPQIYRSIIGQASLGIADIVWLLLSIALTSWAIKKMMHSDKERWLELLISDQGVSLHQRTQKEEEALLAQFLWQDLQNLRLELPPAKKWQSNKASYILLTSQQKNYPFLQEELKREETSYCFYILQAVWEYYQTGDLSQDWLPLTYNTPLSSNTNLSDHLIEED